MTDREQKIDLQMMKLSVDLANFKKEVSFKLGGLMSDSVAYKKSVNTRLDALTEAVNKPLLTAYQSIGVFVILFSYLAASLTYVNQIKLDVQANKSRIESNEKKKEKEFNAILDAINEAYVRSDK